MLNLINSFDLRRSETSWANVAILLLLLFTFLSVGSFATSLNSTTEGGQGSTKVEMENTPVPADILGLNLPTKGGQGST